MSGRVRVLIIDDRLGVRQTLRNILFGLNCDFTDAASGESALAILAVQNFDVTLIDLSLPDIHGIELLERSLANDDAMGSVIVLTGLPDESTREQSFRLGAVAYLSKDPIDRSVIREKFAEAVSRTAPSPPPGASFGAAPRASVASPKRSARWELRNMKAVRQKRRKILVLDDKEYWLETIDRLLQEEFDVVRSTSADDACAKLKADDFALVVLDMKLPGYENGLDVLSRMRLSRPNLRAIILTEYPDWTEAVESGKRGAIDYVSKADPTMLKGVVRQVLDESRPIRVFLSYDRRDKSRVLALYNRLMTRGFIPWMDVKSLIPGQRYELHIEDAVKSCDYFVFCGSHHSIGKEGLLQKELRIALEVEKGKRRGSNFLIPVRLEPCEDHPELKEFQSLDLFQRDGFSRLVKALSMNREIGEGHRGSSKNSRGR